MIDWTATVEGIVAVAALGKWVLSREQRQARKAAETAARLKSHEDSCGSRYAEINGTLARIEDTLKNQDTTSETYREATALSLKEITDKFHSVDKAVAVLEENKRTRERVEDRG